MLKAKHHLSQRKRDNSTIVCSLCSSFPFITAPIKAADRGLETTNNRLNPWNNQSLETTLEWRISKLKISDIKINTSIVLPVCTSHPVRRKLTSHLTYIRSPRFLAKSVQLCSGTVPNSQETAVKRQSCVKISWKWKKLYSPQTIHHLAVAHSYELNWGLNEKWLTVTPTASERGIEDGVWLDPGA